MHILGLKKIYPFLTIVFVNLIHSFYYIQNTYDENNQVTIGVTVFLVITGTMVLVCCIVCRHKRKRAAKKRHFTRLVNDLNASEKFTLVTPSDEESD